MEGIVKMQTIDNASSMYEWSRKSLRLDCIGLVLEIQDCDSSTPAASTYNISDLQYAKEWSFSSSLAGFGWDLVWVTGKISSFLVNEEALCKTWVGHFNQCVAIVNNKKGIRF
jgi:hypothetical protein